jgi:hypothetical protein
VAAALRLIAIAALLIPAPAASKLWTRRTVGLRDERQRGAVWDT